MGDWGHEGAGRRMFLINRRCQMIPPERANTASTSWVSFLSVQGGTRGTCPGVKRVRGADRASEWEPDEGGEGGSDRGGGGERRETRKMDGAGMLTSQSGEGAHTAQSSPGPQCGTPKQTWGEMGGIEKRSRRTKGGKLGFLIHHSMRTVLGNSRRKNCDTDTPCYL